MTSSAEARGRTPLSWLLALAGVSLALSGIPDLASPLTTAEIRWLLEPHSRLASLHDAWVAAAANERSMRAPLLLVALTAPLLAGWSVARSAGLLPGLLAGATIAALPALALGARALGPVGLAAAVTAFALLLASRESWGARFAAAVAAVLGFVLHPPLALVPAGAFLGGFPAARIPGRAASIAVGIVALLVITLLGRGFDLAGSSLEPGSLAAIAERIALGAAAAALLAVAVAPAGGRPRVAGPALVGSLAGLGFLFATGASPAVSASLLVTLPVLAASLRSRIPAVSAIPGLVAAGALVAWGSASSWSAGGVPLEDIGRQLAAARPTPTELLVGGGLPQGVLRRVARAGGLSLVESPTAPVVARLRLAAHRPSSRERREAVRLLGQRVLDGYGVVGAQSRDGFAWSLYRPVEITVAPDAPRPNVAIVSVDTLRADHLSAYGYGRETSPFLREWARGTRLYERAIAPAPETSPSFASLLTGRLPMRHGVRRNYYQLDPGNWTLARILAAAGYETAAFVSSWVLTLDNCGFEPGFDRYDQELDDREATRKSRPIRLAPSLSGRVTEWLDTRASRDDPWFLWVHFIDPHGPYTPLPSFAGTFDTPGVRPLERDEIPAYQWSGSLDFFHYLDAYDDEILQTDHHLRQVIEKIEALPSPHGTIVIFVADHGEQMGEHGRFFEHGQSLHREEVHVPLLVKIPGDAAPGRRPELVSLVDLVPTLLAELRISSDLPLDGRTLSARAEGGSVVVSELKRGVVSLYRDPWKVIVDAQDGEVPRELVYDLRSDWDERAPLLTSGGPGDELLETARALLAVDPLASGDADTDARLWESLSEADRERLRSLGYTAP